MKKENPKLRKLTLNRETMRRLNDGELKPAIGGNTDPDDYASRPISKCGGQGC